MSSQSNPISDHEVALRQLREMISGNYYTGSVKVGNLPSRMLEIIDRALNSTPPIATGLFLVSRTDEGGYDTYDSFVCAAVDAAAAIRLHPRGTSQYLWSEDKQRFVSTTHPDEEPEYDHTWTDKIDTLTVEYLGAVSEDSVQRIVLGSFNAG